MENPASTILVIDDEEELRELVARFLNRKGFQTLEASCGMDAMKILSESKVDLVVSDIRMDNGDGPYVIDQINSKHPDLPVIFISGFSDCETDDLLEKGARAILTKPVDKKALLADITEILKSA